jgi:ABC-type lipoprotein release transport system permease subunit
LYQTTGNQIPNANVSKRGEGKNVKMVKPLSLWKYYRNNQRRIGIVLMVTFLSIILQGTLVIYATSIIRLYQRTLIEPWRTMACIGYSQHSRTKQGLLQKSLGKHPSVAKVLPSTNLETTINGIGSPSLIFVKANEIPALLGLLNLHLTQGRRPAPGSHEALLHWQLAANKGLKMGDFFGNQVSKLDLLPGKFRLVGLLDGKAILGFSDLDTIAADYRLAKDDFSLLVIPKKGRLGQVKHELRKLMRKDHDLYTTAKDEQENRETAGMFILILNTVYLTIAAIVTLCVGFLFYLYYYQRRPEFGLLEALGHTRQMIIGRVLLEILAINLLGFLLGLMLVFFGGWALNDAIFMKRGLPLVLWDPSYPGKLMALPLSVSLCSIIPVWRMIKKVDPISMIEGEE